MIGRRLRRFIETGALLGLGCRDGNGEGWLRHVNVNLIVLGGFLMA